MSVTRTGSWVVAVAIVTTCATRARADDTPASPPAPDPRDGAFDPRLVLDDGRVGLAEPGPTTLSFALRGEYQVRFRAMNDLPLEPPIGAAPGANATLGQNTYVYHWFRLRPVFQYQDVLQIRGEIDAPRGLAFGETTELVTAARDDFAEQSFYDIHPRELYLQYTTPIGLIRVGQQKSHWGMGLLANDGDHASLFGDYRRGTLAERLLFATRPMGKDTPLAIVLAGDVIFEDPLAKLIDGDRAFQGIIAVRWENPRFHVGIYGVVRHQERDRESVDALTPFTEELTVGVLDVAAGFNAPVPGHDAFIVGEVEAALIGGETSFVRNIDLTAAGETENVLSFGGAAKLGLVTVEKTDEGRRFGELAVNVELGYASGDADPYDGVTRRFSFDQNHNVGLVLFDQVMQWKTARAATIARDPAVVNRGAPGLQFLPSEGSIAGATYLNPTVVVRPQHWVDLKAGFVIARTTADFVDPYHAGALGNYANYDGGDERKHDLGLELDAGFDFRVHATESFVLNAGAEGGVFFPGGAFEDERGDVLPNQYLLNTKLGVQF